MKLKKEDDESFFLMVLFLLEYCVRVEGVAIGSSQGRSFDTLEFFPQCDTFIIFYQL